MVRHHGTPRSQNPATSFPVSVLSNPGDMCCKMDQAEFEAAIMERTNYWQCHNCGEAWIDGYSEECFICHHKRCALCGEFSHWTPATRRLPISHTWRGDFSPIHPPPFPPEICRFCLFSVRHIWYLVRRWTEVYFTNINRSSHPNQTQGISRLLPLDSIRHPSCRFFNIAHFNFGFRFFIVPFPLWVNTLRLGSRLKYHIATLMAFISFRFRLFVIPVAPLLLLWTKEFLFALTWHPSCRYPRGISFLSSRPVSGFIYSSLRILLD